MPLSPVLNLAPYPKMDREATASPPAAATLRACIGCYLLVMPRSVQALHPPSGGPHPPRHSSTRSQHSHKPASKAQTQLLTPTHTSAVPLPRCPWHRPGASSVGATGAGAQVPEQGFPRRDARGCSQAPALPFPSLSLPIPSLSLSLPCPRRPRAHPPKPSTLRPRSLTPTPGTPRRVRGTPGFHPPGALREKPGPPPPRPPIPPRPAPGLTAEPGVLLPGADLADLQRPPAERGEHKALPQEVAARVAEAVRGGRG